MQQPVFPMLKTEQHFPALSRHNLIHPVARNHTGICPLAGDGAMSWRLVKQTLTTWQQGVS